MEKSEIWLYDNLKNEKKKFNPIEPGVVSMYNCGPTVYNYAHIGNLRSYVFADILRRMFEYNGYNVKQIINVTDVGHLSGDMDSGEDKMTKALKREGKPLTLKAMREVANFYFEKFKEDLILLNIKPATEYPFASDHINDDIEFVKKLTDKGLTYNTSDGIYFDTSKFPDYGKLGNVHNTDNRQPRIDVNPEKRNPRDFAVWKFNNEKGYDTPFGKGFPGWHIECSAMTLKYLGPEFDIHTGGIDHIPVHHNNEIAQSVSLGYPFAHYWMHNAFLNMGSDKMSKSGENYITLQTLKEKGIDPLALRYVFLTAQYSSPIQFSWEAIEGLSETLKRLREEFAQLKTKSDTNDLKDNLFEEYKKKFNDFINDDLDTPKATALLREVFRQSEISSVTKVKLIEDFDKVLGLRLDEMKEFKIPENVKNLIKERDLARNDKDFAKSDEIRAKIEELGFDVKDTENGSVVTPH